ncbi:hypothetical protein K470DRAFT_258709 [Piedraia hortae CBS 480.64]|uniref:BZIP domain-containing protein n=1 Tax=Piedraia hortae CBS 480.64 TaxID=1314780 RepID=A0A6A7BYB6_9PEZI|nr:hypothetical protein K470DRAFT_258709 [Piedraia hortae CBS 480.64]
MPLPFPKFQSTGHTGPMAAPVVASLANPSMASRVIQPANGNASHHHGWTPRSCEWSSSYPGPSNQQSIPYMHPNGNRPGFHLSQMRVENPRRREQNRKNARKYRERDESLSLEGIRLKEQGLPYLPEDLAHRYRSYIKRVKEKHAKTLRLRKARSGNSDTTTLNFSPETASYHVGILSNASWTHTTPSLHGPEQDSTIDSDPHSQNVAHEDNMPHATSALTPFDQTWSSEMLFQGCQFQTDLDATGTQFSSTTCIPQIIPGNSQMNQSLVSIASASFSGDGRGHYDLDETLAAMRMDSDEQNVGNDWN